MINKPVVLILGAGASWDYGFPTGQLLKAKIWAILSNGRFQNVCRASSQSGSIEPGYFEHFKESLELTPDLSIDAFLEHNFKEFGEVGRKAIARVLLPFEKEINLFGGWMHNELERDRKQRGELTQNKYPFDIPLKGQHWYTYLFNVMSDGVGFSDFKNNKLRVVTFNYDRSFEWFMLRALSSKYQKTIEQSAEVLQSVPITHVYGKLGELSPLDKSDNCIKYGSWRESPIPEYERVINLAAQSIKIIHQDNSCDLEKVSNLQTSFANAHRIYFLGFGFHMTNMERLFHKIYNMPGSGLAQSKDNMLKDNGSNVGGKCYGTALGVSIHLKNKIGEFGLIRMNDNRSSAPKDETLKYFCNLPIYDFLKDSSRSPLSF